jgi:hypothetical protein
LLSPNPGTGIDAGILELYKREAIEEIGLTKKPVTVLREVVHEANHR